MRRLEFIPGLLMSLQRFIPLYMVVQLTSMRLRRMGRLPIRRSARGVLEMPWSGFVSIPKQGVVRLRRALALLRKVLSVLQLKGRTYIVPCSPKIRSSVDGQGTGCLTRGNDVKAVQCLVGEYTVVFKIMLSLYHRYLTACRTYLCHYYIVSS
ncbi:hypothetical protein BABINDRAFT_135634 [Babjeviella inositovora NRRL Y-12698]|uniref:Uncharacterized protein n=1 Tax=Babjeviella inositovora NRRL Y-12698 TaxID=984486 RepID=A0A1E3QQ35_9ASCO|nr:uncharacterized protein BABINDRAFT_135634 [Babjeviella inositovora NRRL Y-12698]ODQ79771.1 hypothetical protein BABINDRAFT_135634 [Babjeviella inositovora NRRL Y-12698]